MFVYPFIFYLIFLFKNVVAYRQYGSIQITVVYSCLCCQKVGNVLQFICEIWGFGFTVCGLKPVFISPGTDAAYSDIYMEQTREEAVREKKRFLGRTFGRLCKQPCRICKQEGWVADFCEVKSMSNCYECNIKGNSGYYLKENKLEKYKSRST